MKILNGVFISILLMIDPFLIASQCPIPHDPLGKSLEGCFCSQKNFYTSLGTVVLCSDLGYHSEFPPLNPSNDTIFEFKLNGESEIETIQNDAFKELKVKKITLANIGLKRLNEFSFRYLERYLSEIYLDNNDIENLPRGLFSNFEKLKYIALHNNLIKSIQSDTFSGINSIISLNLYNNKINAIDERAFSSLSKLRDLSLQINNITSLDGLLFQNCKKVFRLNLSNNNISFLHEDLLEKLTSLKFLDISYNNLREMPEKLLHNSKRLRQLNLESNNLHDLPRDTFQSNAMLKYISMSSNAFHSVVDIFNNTVRLETIQLQKNKIKNINKETFKNLLNLKQLDLSNNHLINVTADSFKSNVNLKSLSLKNSSIVFIPNDIFSSLKKLEFLDLSCNSIPQLSDRVFRNFSDSIIELNISYNTFKRVPSICDVIPSLQYMSMQNNLIDVIYYDDFRNLPNLRYLDLSKNNINRIEGLSFDTNKKLLVLNLANNYLTEMGRSTVYGLTSISELYIENNNLSTIFDSSFVDLNQMEELHLQNNSIKDISGKTLAGMSSLKFIDLTSNKIELIPNDTFGSMHKLESLNLANNSIITLEMKAFDGLKELKILNISSNQINEIPPETLTKLKELQIIAVDDNSLKCSCDYSYFINQIKEQEITSMKCENDKKNITIFACYLFDYCQIDILKLDKLKIACFLTTEIPSTTETSTTVAVTSFSSSLRSTTAMVGIPSSYSTSVKSTPTTAGIESLYSTSVIFASTKAELQSSYSTSVKSVPSTVGIQTSLEPFTTSTNEITSKITEKIITTIPVLTTSLPPDFDFSSTVLSRNETSNKTNTIDDSGISPVLTQDDKPFSITLFLIILCAVCAFVYLILVTILLCVLMRPKLTKEENERHVPTTYGRLGKNISNSPSLSISSIEEPYGDTFSIWQMPTGIKGGSDWMKWKHFKEGMSASEEKTYIIEKLMTT